MSIENTSGLPLLRCAVFAELEGRSESHGPPGRGENGHGWGIANPVQCAVSRVLGRDC
jgi:hypothetical protein